MRAVKGFGRLPAATDMPKNSNAADASDEATEESDEVEKAPSDIPDATDPPEAIPEEVATPVDG